MSFTDRLVLWLHIGFAIFTIGPVTVAISSTPRYIRNHNLIVVQYLYRMTRVFTIGSLVVLIAGLVAAQQNKDFSKPWLSIALTLFVVAIVLLVLIMRDQHRAIGALQTVGPAGVPPPAGGGTPAAVPPGAGAGVSGGPAEAIETPLASSPSGAAAVRVAAVERGRIATMGGVVSIIWLVILVLMVWNS
jgi:hypothetical protein